MIGIYKIQSIIKPNRIYIGSSSNIIDRWKRHIGDLKNNVHHSKKLQNHFNKYGIADLSFSIIIECEIDILIETEQSFLDSYKPYFNICKIAGITLGYKHSEETKLKMRKPKSSDHIKKMSENKKGKATWNKGRTDLPPHSKESNIKRSLALKGKKKSEEHVKNMRASRKNKVKQNNYE